MSATAPPAPVVGSHRLRELWRTYAASRMAWLALASLLLLVALALLAPWVAPQNPYDPLQQSIVDARLPPGSVSSVGGYVFKLGSDELGRDLYSAILYGLRISLLVGLLCAALAGLVGTALGLLAAYFGGRVDSLIMRLTDAQLSFPAILIALMLLSVFGKGIDKIILALVLVQWTHYARTVRGSALVELRKEYVEAARGLQCSHLRIMFRHILPNCLPPLIVVGTLQIAIAIGLEATLSFLGLGLPITEPSLGMLVANGYSYMLSGQYWISLFPGLALVWVVLSINAVADRLGVALNPRLSR